MVTKGDNLCRRGEAIPKRLRDEEWPFVQPRSERTNRSTSNFRGYVNRAKEVQTVRKAHLGRHRQVEQRSYGPKQEIGINWRRRRRIHVGQNCVDDSGLEQTAVNPLVGTKEPQSLGQQSREKGIVQPTNRNQRLEQVFSITRLLLSRAANGQKVRSHWRAEHRQIVDQQQTPVGQLSAMIRFS